MSGRCKFFLNVLPVLDLSADATVAFSSLEHGFPVSRPTSERTSRLTQVAIASPEDVVDMRESLRVFSPLVGPGQSFGKL